MSFSHRYCSDSRPLVVLAAVSLCAACPAEVLGAVARPGRHTAVQAKAIPAEMRRIPAGSYEPLYHPPGAGRVPVRAFALDRNPVTRGEYLAFVRARPAWRREVIKPIFAEPDYLADWPGALDAGTAEDLARPITYVSWFAAKAYCAWRGKRLPTVDEWEYAAAASATRRDAAHDPAFVRALIALYAAPRPIPLRTVGHGVRNAYGINDMHGVVWEWTLDFNNVTVPDDSRERGSGVAGRDLHLYCASAVIGASDPSNYPAFLRYAVRAGLTGRTTTATLGVRCAMNL